MWSKALAIRNETCLRACIDHVKHVQNEEMLERDAREGDVFEPFSLRNLCEVGLLVATSALQRRESRGSHYREDYPEIDQSMGKPILLEASRAPRSGDYRTS